MLLAERLGERADVHKLVLEEVRVSVKQLDQVVARLHVSLGGVLGGQLEGGDGVHPHRDTGLLPEHLGLPAQLVVRGPDEVTEAEELQLALLSADRRPIEGQRGAGRRRGEEESTA
jgi:hypothetical protein